MNVMQVVRAVAFGICVYAGLYHLLVGLRRRPTDRVHLSFALAALAYGLRNGCELFPIAGCPRLRAEDGEDTLITLRLTLAWERFRP